jgi:hypothetical protein
VISPWKSPSVGAAAALAVAFVSGCESHPAEPVSNVQAPAVASASASAAPPAPPTLVAVNESQPSGPSADSAAEQAMCARAGKKLGVDPARCATCEANNCLPTVKRCSAFSERHDRDLCNAVLECARQTNCAGSSPVDCYCGPGIDVLSCRGSADKAKGLCKDVIVAGMPKGASSGQIVSTLTNPDLPAGNALDLVQCDLASCGEPKAGGHGECKPYCK